MFETINMKNEKVLVFDYQISLSSQTEIKLMFKMRKIPNHLMDKY